MRSAADEHALFVLLERRRHVALGARQRLPALVVGRDRVAVRVRDFDVVAEDAIVSDLERRDAGSRALGRLDLGDPVLPAVAQGPQLVEGRVDARPRSSARPRWRTAAARPAAGGSARRHRRSHPSRALSASELRPRALAACDAGDGGGHLLEPRDRVAERPQLPRRRARRGRFTASRSRSRTPSSARSAAPAGRAHRRPAHRHGPAAPRSPHGSVSGARIHWRSSRAPIGVWVRSSTSMQRALAVATAQRLDELQIAPRHVVDRHHARGRSTTGRPRWGTPPAAARGDSAATRRRRPIAVASSAPMPNPSSDATPKCRRELVASARAVELPRVTLGQQHAIDPEHREGARPPRLTRTSRWTRRASIARRISPRHRGDAELPGREIGRRRSRASASAGAARHLRRRRPRHRGSCCVRIPAAHPRTRRPA